MSSPSGTMTAAVMTVAGPPSVLEIKQLPIPVPSRGQILIKIHASGLNRSELFTRQGHSPNLTFPRVLGIEATGTVAAAPGHEARFPIGTPCATAMGGLGRDFDGGYAEYCLAAASNVHLLPPAAVQALGWPAVAACPEMLQTAWGSLHFALRLRPADLLLIRGGTTSVGLAAAALARDDGVGVIVATTRRPLDDEEATAAMRSAGVTMVLRDDGDVAAQIVQTYPDGVSKVLELVGTTTLRDSLRCANQYGGTVCMTGIVGNAWSMDGFAPMDDVGSGRFLTVYDGGAAQFMGTPLAELVEKVAAGDLYVQLGKTFALEEIVLAHETMEANKAGGKAVIVTKFGREAAAAAAK